MCEQQGPTIDIGGFRNFGDISIVGKISKKFVYKTVEPHLRTTSLLRPLYSAPNKSSVNHFLGKGTSSIQPPH